MAITALGPCSHYPIMELAYPNSNHQFKDYAILGDDVLITDGNVARTYREILSKLGVEISESKSITSKTGCIEFAKRFWVKGMQRDITQIALSA